MSMSEFSLTARNRSAGLPSQIPARALPLQALRGIDVVLALLLLLALAPLLVYVALMVRLEDDGPIIFAHERIGADGRRFRCLKFRTMVVDAETRLRALLEADPLARSQWAADHKLKHDPRITAIGRFLRKSSLDELPQIFNVLRGEMSFVGPRPIVLSEVQKYGHHIAAYYRVKPGITGLWQVSGRNDVSYRRRVACDVLFARNLTPLLYFQILALTAPAVLLRRGSY